jgi:hypothetical protein
MFAILAKLNKLVVNFWRKAHAPPAPVYQEVVQILRQANVVLPQTSNCVRNSRKPLKQCLRLDLYREACSPSCRSG